MHVGAPSLREAWAYGQCRSAAKAIRRACTGTRNWLFVKVYTDEGLVGHRRMQQAGPA